MANFFLTNKAVNDLSQIWDYTRKTWSEKQAENYYNLIISKCQEVAKNTQLGKNYNEIAPFLRGISIKQHIVFYRAINKNKVEITRILHQKMDYQKRLEK